jgi:polyphosphate kinase
MRERHSKTHRSTEEGDTGENENVSADPRTSNERDDNETDGGDPKPVFAGTHPGRRVVADGTVLPGETEKTVDVRPGENAAAATGATVHTADPPRETFGDVEDVLEEGDPGSLDLSDDRLYLNRELSELAFQRRVLHEAEDERNPLLERVRFLSIFTKNMDEFFMKRVGGLKQQMAADVSDLTADGRTPSEQWETILEESRETFERHADTWGTVRPLLAEAGIRVLDYDDLSEREREDLRTYFETSVLPTLTPLTFDPAHPFPFISNLSLSLGVLTRAESDEEPKFSRVKIPRNRPRLVRVGDDHRYVPLEAVVAANLDLLFPDVEIIDYCTFRVTRNAEVRRNQEVAEDLIETIEEVLRERRFATVVRLELEANAPDRVREVLVEQLDLDEREVFEREGMLDLRDLMTLTDVNRPDLKIEPWTPQSHPELGDRDEDIFESIRRGDVLVHHPYHSFDDTVHRFLDEAANDPDVLAIKAAIYRTASDSKVIESLIEAAKNGKQVAVMVELKARFDEEANLEWVEKLEEEGVHVAYGTIGLKTHTKTSLVVREEGEGNSDITGGPGSDGVRLYSHVGTGNYHSETAKGYEDLGLLTADQDIGQDLVRLFNFFTGHSLHKEYRELLIAPTNMRDKLKAKIRREAEHARAGDPARIVAKMNRLEDPDIIRELYRASRAGVSIDLIVRDICRLRPGVPEISENVSVSSIVGRFLEHSRAFRFENGGDREYFIGSADWMTRNLDSRVEAVAPVTDPDLRARIDWVLDRCLADNRNRWVMGPDGRYVQKRPDDDPAISVQKALMERIRAEGR